MAPVLMITGAGGFLGRACLAALRGSPYRLHAVSRTGRPIPGFDGPVRAADLTDPDSAARLVARVRPAVLLHLAWIAAPNEYRDSPENERWLESGRVMFRAFAETGGQRAVVAGTCLEYERAGGIPATPYARCKDGLRTDLESLRARGGPSCAWARLFFLYGPGEHPLRLTAWLIRSFLADRPAELKSPDRRLDFLHVADAAAALAGLCGAAAGGAFDVGSGERRTVGAHARGIAERVGRPDLLQMGPPTTAGDAGELPAADIRRLCAETGWAPRIGHSDGVDDAIAWWRAQRSDA